MALPRLYMTLSPTTLHCFGALLVSFLRMGAATAVSPIRVVYSTMGGLCQSYQVLRAIVSAVAVDMVNVLVAAQQPAKRLLGNEAMFRNVPFGISFRVAGAQNPDVAIRGNSPLFLRKIALLTASIVPVNIEPRVAGITVRARDVLVRNSCLPAAAAKAIAMRWIVRGRANPASGLLSRCPNIRSSELMAWYVMVRRTLLWYTLERLVTPALTDFHAVSIAQQKGAV